MNIFDPKNKTAINQNSAILTGNHDLPSLRQVLDDIINPPEKVKRGSAKIKKNFEEFCRTELQLTPEEIKNTDTIFENLIKWHYTRDVKQVQTTLQDALGIYFRPNIPGFWNGGEDKYLMKPTPEGMLSYWSSVFPKDFLVRENHSGINPGYKNFADKFVQIMQELFS